MAFRVEVTAPARRDAREILDWLDAQQAGESGLRWFKKLEDAVLSLSNLPGRCPSARENPSFPFETRQLLYGRKPHQYRVLFTISGKTVFVLRIRHGRRKPLTQH